MTDHHQPETPPVTDDGPPGLPLWVKAAAVVVALLLLAYLVLQFTALAGGHGPGMHSSSGLPADSGVTAPRTPGA